MTSMDEEQLAEVFSQLDTGGKGYLTPDELNGFAIQLGFQDVDKLAALDYDNSGKITFANFARGVRALVGQATEPLHEAREGGDKGANTARPDIDSGTQSGAASRQDADRNHDSSGLAKGRRVQSTHDTLVSGSEHVTRVADSGDGQPRDVACKHGFGSRRGSTHPPNSSHTRKPAGDRHTHSDSDETASNHDEDRDEESGDELFEGSFHSNDTPRRVMSSSSVRRRLTSANSFDRHARPDIPEGDEAQTSELVAHINELEHQVLDAQQDLEDARQEKTEVEEDLVDLRRKHTTLQQRCTEYEKQLDTLTESHESSWTTISELREMNDTLLKEKQESIKMLSQQISELEGQLQSASTERDMHKAEADSLTISLKEEIQNGKAYRLQIIELDEQLKKVLAEAKSIAGEAEKQAKLHVKSILEEKRDEHEKEKEQWLYENDRLKTSAKEKLLDLEGQVHALEEQNKTKEEEIATLKEKNAKLQRQVMQTGMKMAAIPARSDESLAAEMNKASRDDLVDEIKSQEERIRGMGAYLERLLERVMEFCPEILEVA